MRRVQETYACKGRPSIDPVVFFKLQLVLFFEGLRSERQLMGHAADRLSILWYLGKECLDLDGTPSTFGLPSRANTLATQDDIYVARMREAGAIILGKTNVAQLLYYIESDNPLYGRTNNPWNLDRSSGGSSGGQAAIIAAGGSPLGLGTDLGGSIRVPATFCGIAGLKPTAGRTPDAGLYSKPFGERAIVSQVGLLARQVEDVALVFMAQRSRPTLAVIEGLLGLLGQQGMTTSIRNFGHRDTQHYWQLVEEQMEYQRRFLDALDNDEGEPFDLILCPACSLPAFTHGSASNLILAGGYTALYNVLGYPTGIVPVTRVRSDEEVGCTPSRDIVEQTAHKVELGSSGVPVGVQVVARPWREHVSLAAMRAIEEVVCARNDYPGIAMMNQEQGFIE